MFRSLVGLVGALLIASFVPFTAAEEQPQEGDCDATDLLVCAGAEAAGSVECSFVTPTNVACDWARGILWMGFSPTALPGEVEGTTNGFVEYCVDQDCTLETTGLQPLPTCAWLPALDCIGSDGADGSVGPFELAMGQCLLVTAGASLSVTARVVDDEVTLGEVTFDNEGEGADQECLLDDGRN